MSPSQIRTSTHLQKLAGGSCHDKYPRATACYKRAKTEAVCVYYIPAIDTDASSLDLIQPIWAYRHQQQVKVLLHGRLDPSIRPTVGQCHMLVNCLPPSADDALVASVRHCMLGYRQRKYDCMYDKVETYARTHTRE